jgi:hypothetical protein
MFSNAGVKERHPERRETKEITKRNTSHTATLFEGVGKSGRGIPVPKALGKSFCHYTKGIPSNFLVIGSSSGTNRWIRVHGCLVNNMVVI